MLSYIFSMAWTKRGLSGLSSKLEWQDPIDHPAIKAMTLRELADLPFPRPCRELTTDWRSVCLKPDDGVDR